MKKEPKDPCTSNTCYCFFSGPPPCTPEQVKQMMEYIKEYDAYVAAKSKHTRSRNKQRNR